MLEAVKRFALSMKHFALSEIHADEVAELTEEHFSLFAALEDAKGELGEEAVERLMGACVSVAMIADRLERSGGGGMRREMLEEIVERSERIVQMVEEVEKNRVRSVRAEKA